MFIKNSNVVKCSETKRQFTENRIFFLIVLVKKNESSFISEQNAAMPSWEILVYCFNPLSFSDFKFSAWNFFTI